MDGFFISSDWANLISISGELKWKGIHLNQTIDRMKLRCTELNWIGSIGIVFESDVVDLNQKS